MEEIRFLESGMLEAGLGNRFVPIRRSNMLLDGFDHLSRLGAEGLKGRVRVSFIDQYGQQEAGVVSRSRLWDFLRQQQQQQQGRQRQAMVGRS